MATSDNGNKDSGKGRDKGGSNDNNLRSSKDMGKKMGNNMGSNTSSYRIGGSNRVQDKVPSLPVNNTIHPPDYDGIGLPLLYPE